MQLSGLFEFRCLGTEVVQGRFAADYKQNQLMLLNARAERTENTHLRIETRVESNMLFERCMICAALA